MKIKKLLCTLLALCILLTLVPVSVSAADVVDSGNLDDNFTWSITKDGRLTLAGTGAMPDLERPTLFEGNPWEDYAKNITSVTFTEGITYIGSYTLYELNAVKEVMLPSTLKVIGSYAFYYCQGLETLTLPKGLTEIGSYAFSMMKKLNTITIPAKVTQIGEDVFSNCSNLQSIQVDAKNTVYASDERGVLFTKDMTTLLAAPCGLAGFYTIPSGTERISDRAFATNPNLNVVSIPATVNSIGKNAFMMCQGLDEIWFYGNAPQCDFGAFDWLLGENDDDFSVIAYYPKGNNTWTEDVRTAMISDAQWEPFALYAPVVTGSNVEKTGKIRLTWEPVEDAVQYKVYRSTSKNGTYSLMKTTTGTSYTNTNAVAGKYYYYKVVAIAENGAASSPSAIVGRTCDLPQPVVTASNVEKSGKVRLTWEPIEGAVSYKVYRAASKNGTYSLMKTTTGTSYTNTNAAAGVKYYYKVVAVAEKSAANSAAALVSRTCNLPQPVVTASNVVKTGKVQLSWEPVEGAVQYKVYRATEKDGKYSLMKTLTNTVYINTSAVAGVKYYYKVVAVAENTDANSTAALVSRTCNLAQVQPTASLNDKGKPTVTWQAIDGAVSYKVYRATAPDGKYSMMKNLTSTIYVNANFVSGTTYYYKVVAICDNTDGNAAASPIVSITAK